MADRSKLTPGRRGPRRGASVAAMRFFIRSVVFLQE
jgi:hypothetical protein